MIINLVEFYRIVDSKSYPFKETVLSEDILNNLCAFDYDYTLFFIRDELWKLYQDSSIIKLDIVIQTIQLEISRQLSSPSLLIRLFRMLKQLFEKIYFYEIKVNFDHIAFLEWLHILEHSSDNELS